MKAHLHSVDGREPPAASAAARAISPIPTIIAELKAGRMAVLVDEEDRENEGDLIIAADCITPDAINFMATHGRGLICMPITEARARQLQLAPMTAGQSLAARHQLHCLHRGRQRRDDGHFGRRPRAHDPRRVRARTRRPRTSSSRGTCFRWSRRREACWRAPDTPKPAAISRGLAGHSPAAVLCEIMNDDGTMARLPDLIEFARRHDLQIGAIADLIHYRSQTERLIERVGERPIRTAEGDFRLVTFRDKLNDATHLALTRGEIAPERETLVRVHEPLSVVDLLDYGSRTHSWTIPAALAAIARAGRGVLVLLHRPESALDLRQRAMNDQPPTEMRMDLRNYGIGAQILRDLNVGRMRLLAKPRKMPSMAGFGLEVTGHEDVAAAPLPQRR